METLVWISHPSQVNRFPLIKYLAIRSLQARSMAKELSK